MGKVVVKPKKLIAEEKNKDIAEDKVTSSDEEVKKSISQEKTKSLFSFCSLSMLMLFIGVSALVTAVVMEAVRLDEKNKTLEKEVKNANKNIEETLDRLKVAVRKEASANEKVESLTESIKLMSQNTELLNKEKHNLEDEITIKDKIVIQLQSESEELLERLHDSLNENSNHEHNLKKRSDEISDLETDLINLKDEGKEHKDIINTLETKLKTTADQLTDASDRIIDLTISEAEKEDILGKAQENLSESNKKLEEEMSSKQQITESLTANLLAAENNSNLKQDEIDRLSNEISIALQENNEFRSQINEEKAKKELIDTELTNCQTSVELKIQENFNIIQDKEAENLLQEQAINDLTRENEKITSQLSNLESETSSKIDLLENDFKQCDEATTTLNVQREEMKSRINTLDKQNQENIEKINSMKIEKESLFNGMEQMDSRLAALQTLYDESERNLLVSQSDAGKCVVERSEVTLMFKTLEEEKNVLGFSLENSINEKKTLADELENIKKEKLNLVDEIGQLKTSCRPIEN